MMGIVVMLVGATSCENWNSDEPVASDSRLVKCWHLVRFCDAAVDADIHISFAANDEFVIYQRIEALNYTVLTGTYTANTNTSVLSGVYSDGTSWNSDYKYSLDEKALELVLESVNNPSEIAVYQSADMPDMSLYSASRAVISDVKPL